MFLAAAVIGISSLLYTNQLVKELSEEEQKKIAIWAEASRRIIRESSENMNAQTLLFYVQIIQNNTTVPVIVVDSEGDITMSRNVDSVKMQDPKYAARLIEKMKEAYDPIRFQLTETGNTEYVFYYYKSTLLTRLTYYPYVQLGVIMLFIIVAYFAFSSSRKAEQNQVWLGLSKETAHQLGTPISSLLAWHEMIKQNGVSPEIESELGKDILRLEKIAERFSKIGSKPKLHFNNIIDLINNSLSYIRTRSSNRIKIIFEPEEDAIKLPVNPELFEWVIENLCKNAIDAMNGEGTLQVSLHDNTQVLYIDVKDTGSGLPKNKFKTIFKPGYTTKSRGWGLGLSLSKRIIEEYHDGRIFVHSSEPEKGTVMRIVLNKFIER